MIFVVSGANVVFLFDNTTWRLKFAGGVDAALHVVLLLWIPLAPSPMKFGWNNTST